jgi:uncharacterized protein (DUF2267 family)
MSTRPAPIAGDAMSATGLDVFDRTIHTTNLWLKEIAEEIGPDRRRAYHALSAVLRALRDRLTLEEAAQLAAQLPLLVRGIYYDQWRPVEQPKRARHLADFLALIAQGEGEIKPIDPEDAARAVFKVLDRHISRGEIEQVKAELPAEIRSLWP